MYMILLTFSENRDQAPRFLDGHKAWIARGFEDGVFLLVGSLKPDGGGGIVAHGATLAEMRERVQDDPFVAEDIVKADIVQISPARADDRLAFLLGENGAS